MATYKLIQDIEAEDHILGPLTLRQFIFAMIAVFLLYLCYFVTAKGAAFLLVIFAPPALFFGFFAMPFGRDQSTEVWALAKLRYFLKPRRRIWDQSGVKELVTITVPKRVEPVLTDGLNPYEVQSRLKALADTIDSRGWAVKNVAVGSVVQPIMGGYRTDRLIDVSALPQAVPDDDTARDDVLDVMTNPVAQQFDSMITQSAQTHRQQLIDTMNAPAAAQGSSGYWFMNQPAAVPAVAATERTGPADPEILSLANNNDLDIATLAREASKSEAGDKDTSSPRLTVASAAPATRPPQPSTSIPRAVNPEPAVSIVQPTPSPAPVITQMAVPVSDDSPAAVQDAAGAPGTPADPAANHAVAGEDENAEPQEVVINLH